MNLMQYQADLWARESPYEENLTKNSDKLPKPWVFFFVVLTFPVWLFFSIVAEVVVVPIVTFCRFAEAFWGKGFLGILTVLSSPIVYLVLTVVSTVVAPISILLKTVHIWEDEYLSAMEGLIYPSNHPVFSRFINTEAQEEGYVQNVAVKINKKKKKNAVSTATMTSEKSLKASMIGDFDELMIKEEQNLANKLIEEP